MGKSVFWSFSVAIALAATPALAQTQGDTTTVTIGPASGDSIITCGGREEYVTCDGDIAFLNGNASIDWTPPDGWIIVGTPTPGISGDNASYTQPLQLVAGGGSYMAQYDVRRAYAIALKLARLAGKADTVQTLVAERDKLLATYGSDGTIANRVQLAGTCSGDCTVAIWASANLVYVGHNDPFALLVSLVRRFKL